jgi:hypothetical protein
MSVGLRAFVRVGGVAMFSDTSGCHEEVLQSSNKFSNTPGQWREDDFSYT